MLVSERLFCLSKLGHNLVQVFGTAGGNDEFVNFERFKSIMRQQSFKTGDFHSGSVG